MTLSPRERAILELERVPWKYPAAKAGFILDFFGLSQPRYFVKLEKLLERADAEEYDPVTVRRLRRLREQRTMARARHTVLAAPEAPKSY